ncbi:MAG: ELM1/GtrOC1 family putative glycosyltransferase [Sulfurovum sp.]|nr:ELM1/GtrOC1 family putative glycosyltransferase [Sulfurovum sp.]
MNKKILRLTDGKAGHVFAIDGVIAALNQEFNFDVINVDVKIRAKFLLQIMKLLIHYSWFDKCLKKNPNLLKIFYKNFSLPKEHIDLILSTGGDTSYINVWLSRILNTNNIYCSGLRGLKADYFTLLISSIRLDCNNYIIFKEAFPNKNILKDMSKSILEFSKRENIDINDKYFVLLLGGDTGRKYEYSIQDWKDIIDGFMYHVKKENAKALISTSRRTGLKNETLIKEFLEPYQNDIAYTIYFNHKPEKLLGIFLPLASKIFVTEESGSMIGESLYYCKPIFTISPRKIRTDKKYNQYLENLAGSKRIKSTKSYQLKDIDLINTEFQFMENNPMEELAKELKLHLKGIL